MNKKFLLVLAAFALYVSTIKAQYQVPDYDSIPMEQIELNEVVVKSVRENSVIIKNLPASITLFKANDLNNHEITSLKNLGGYVPNFFMPDYGSRLTSPVYIRGIGSRINSPSVGLYVDNVPYFEKSVFDFEFSDIERVEVLRGPQGTAYGRNTMGGLIKIFTKDPTEMRESRIALSGGNYGLFRADASHAQPIGESAGISLSAFFNRNSGFYTNEFENTAIDKENVYGGRVKFVSDLSSYTKIQFASSFEHSYQGGYPYARINMETGHIAPINYDYFSSYERTIVSNAFTIDYESKDFLFQSITSHQFLTDDQNIDQDFTPASLFTANQNTNQNMIAQEFTFRSKAGRKISWVAGVFGFLQLFDDEVSVSYGQDGIAAFNLPGETSMVKNYDNTIRGIAYFGESTVNDLFTQGLSITAGIRVDVEEASQRYLFNSFIVGNQTTLDDSEGNVTYSEILPKASLSYKISPNITPYTSIAKGYKAGGFNTTFESEEDRSFKPEYSWNYEGGIKTLFFQKALLANISAFYIDWKDQQIYQPVPSGQGSMLKNAGKSVSKGFEVEVIARPIRNLSIYTSYGYTQAKFTQYQRTPVLDLSGNYIPYAPGNTLHVGADWSINVDDQGLNKIILFAGYQGQGDIYWNEENSVSQDFYGLLNGKISYSAKFGRIDLWAKNILNEEYTSFFFSALGNNFVQIGKPFHFGANLIVKF